MILALHSKPLFGESPLLFDFSEALLLWEESKTNCSMYFVSGCLEPKELLVPLASLVKLMQAI